MRMQLNNVLIKMMAQNEQNNKAINQSLSTRNYLFYTIENIREASLVKPCWREHKIISFSHLIFSLSEAI